MQFFTSNFVVVVLPDVQNGWPQIYGVAAPHPVVQVSSAKFLCALNKINSTVLK